MNIEGKVAIVTGAASGVGNATAKHFASIGAKVVCMDINEHVMNVADELSTLGVVCDVTKEDDVIAAIDKIENELGEIRIVINCAGVIYGARVVGKKGPHSLEDFQRVMNINVNGTFNLIRICAERMSRLAPVPEHKDEERGTIVNISSIAAYEAQIGQAAYAASKGAVASMTLPIARELAKHGIRINSIAPGVMWTPMIENLPEKAQQNLLDGTIYPRRLGTPEEFADFAAHITTNVFINGAVLRMDGAVRMSP